jgi:hypothetical protein
VRLPGKSGPVPAQPAITTSFSVSGIKPNNYCYCWVRRCILSPAGIPNWKSW